MTHKSLSKSLVYGAVTAILVSFFFAGSVFSSTPTEEWEAIYGPISGWGEPSSLAIDTLGNVIVTGEGGTVKYDPDGNELWNVSSEDDYNAITADNSNNVYVTGTRTVKYDADGTELWSHPSGVSYRYFSYLSVAVDSLGNVYITGPSSLDKPLVKYDPDGNELWAAATGTIDGYHLVLDGSGNIYITGHENTIKYDADGTELWSRSKAGFGGYALALDSAGNVIVAGEIEISGNPVACTIKYDPDGTELWVATYSGPQVTDVVGALVVDGSDNIIVTGVSIIRYYGQFPSNIPDSDVLTIKYDPDGNELWNRRYGSSVYFIEFGVSIAMDDSGYIYVYGMSSGFTNPGVGVMMIMYDQDGSQVWVVRDPSVILVGLRPFALDNDRNLYYVGDDPAYIAGGPHAWHTVKYAPPPCIDNDEDGYGDPASYTCDHWEFDCDDQTSDDPAICDLCLCGEADCAPCARCIHPGAAEFANDGIDSDCNSNTPAWGTPTSVMGTFKVRSDPLNYIFFLLAAAGAILILKGLKREK